MLLRLKNLLADKVHGIQKRKLLRSGGPPASWYDSAYTGGTEEYHLPYVESRYMPVWQAICDRIPQGACVLEVGCGSAQFASMLDDRSLVNGYVGFDFSPAAVELARANLPGRRVEVADARTTDLFTTVEYDTLVCTEVLEHIVDDLLVIQQIPRGKRVLATVPDFDYVSHVRFFRSVDEVRTRYGPLFDSLVISEHFHAGDLDGSSGTFFLLNGVR